MLLPNVRGAPPPVEIDGMLREYVPAPPREPLPYAAGARICGAGDVRIWGAAPYEPLERGHAPAGIDRPPDAGADRAAVRGSTYAPGAGARETVRGVENELREPPPRSGAGAERTVGG